MRSQPQYPATDNDSQLQWSIQLPDSQKQYEASGPEKRKALTRDSEYYVLQPTGPNASQESLQPQARAGLPLLPSKRAWGWSWELLCLAVVVICFAAVVGLLLALQDRPVPDWPSGITVNALLSVLVTVMKGVTGIIIAECLSQLKWQWFKREKSLVDLVIWDEASRGIWGAGRLLMTPRTWYLGYLGALTFLAAFVIGPTIQQTVEVRVRQVEVPTNASVRLCNSSHFSLLGLNEGIAQIQADLPTPGAIYNGFVQSSTQSPLRPSCPSGNCTFGTYQSLGLCHECKDRSEELILGDNALNASADTCSADPGCAALWPDTGIALAFYGMINTTTDFSYFRESGTTFPEPVATDSMIYRWYAITGLGDSPAKRAPVAIECQLRFCVKTYDAVVEAGEFKERLLDSSWNGARLDGGVQYDFSNTLLLPARPCFVDGAEIEPPADEADDNPCLYRVNGTAVFTIGSTISYSVEGDGYGNPESIPLFETDVLQGLYGMFGAESLSSGDVGTLPVVDRAWQSMADLVTDHSRNSDSVCDGATTQGIQWRDQLYLHVHWIWLTPTIVVFIVCLAFFVATIVQAFGEHLWKSSPLALLVNRPWSGDREVLPEELLRLREPGQRADLAAIEAASRGMQVRMELEPAANQKG